jgi:hypothetical protein
MKQQVAQQTYTRKRQGQSYQQRGDIITYSDSQGRDVEYDVEEDDNQWPQRQGTSAVRYQGNTPRYQLHPDQVQPMVRRKSAVPIDTQRTTEDMSVAPPYSKRRWRPHPLFVLGFGMLLMLGLWQGLTMFSNWWQVHQDDATYGRPRTAQYDVIVGHNDSPTNKTHIIALNLNARVEIIELPGGDSSHAKIYQGPQLFGQNADLFPVTLSFRDVNGDGLLDMVINVQGAQIIYLNKNGAFVPPPSH